MMAHTKKFQIKAAVEKLGCPSPRHSSCSVMIAFGRDLSCISGVEWFLSGRLSSNYMLPGDQMVAVFVREQ